MKNTPLYDFLLPHITRAGGALHLWSAFLDFMTDGSYNSAMAYFTIEGSGLSLAHGKRASGSILKNNLN
jgi:hypothetical protein